MNNGNFYLITPSGYSYCRPHPPGPLPPGVGRGNISESPEHADYPEVILIHNCLPLTPGEGDSEGEARVVSG